MSWRTLAKSNSDLINGIKNLGLVKSDIVFQAMKNVDRGHFADDKATAYFDRPQSIGYGATISAPHMHAFAMEDLKDHIHKGARILDVGSGSGYLCACFAEMLDILEKGDKDLSYEGQGRVFGLEIVKELVDKSVNNLKKFDKGRKWLESGRIRIIHGNGWEGLDEVAGPFDAIHVGAAAEEVPQKLMHILAPGGRCVIPVGEQHNTQYYKVIDKTLDGEIKASNKMEVQYVPLVRQGKGMEKRKVSNHEQKQQKGTV
eukprot:CAMPEP_0117453594 /NCGR_PEP_ID=MMETSP0759-20121206/10313_1 /TAXON_ID=63605 /ORGANISM="Percolomonas cosmopolitus, Strain WS" /LENGTH=257 /DNA_ID=CAMNT_0005246649 /DNA_START=1574 /DNA_END=2347 /DNA_ORIENTATION=-